MEHPPSAPWSDLHAQLHRVLRQRSLLPRGARVVVAVSGGQDSVALLRLLLDLQPKWQWHLWAVHGNHGWRPDAADNVTFVADLCQTWGVPCQVVRADPPPATEADARQWRYEILGHAAQALGATHIATGHTATDRAETLLYNLLRGSGTDGLQALAWERPLDLGEKESALTVVRPLLFLSRQATGDFCQRENLPLWVDSTNADLTYTRNWLRLEVFPCLETHVHPRIVHTLAQTAEILTAEVALLDQLTDDLYQRVRVQQVGERARPSFTDPPSKSPSDLWKDPLGPCGDWVLQREPLRSAPLALQRRLLRRVLHTVLTAAVTFDQVEKLVALISAPNRTQTDPFPGGWLAQVEGDHIRILRPDSILFPLAPWFPT
jgi:tRNA(Ile)-lysidine synthase